MLARIRGLLPTLTRAQRTIAQAILRDPEQFIARPISELAEVCGVSVGSIVLLCKALKLSGFPALKISLARELTEAVLLSRRTREEIRGRGHPVLQQVFEAHIESLHQTLKLNLASSLDTAVKALLNAKRIVFFSIGLSYPIALSLYARLRFLGLPTFIEYDSHLQLVAAAETQRGEVAVGVSLSGSTGETVECLRLSKARGATTICITNSIDSALARAASIRLYGAPSDVKYFQAPLASRVSQLALVDALVALVSLRRRRQALTRLRRAEEHLLKRRVPNPRGASR